MFDKTSQNSINAEDIFSNVDKKPDGEVEVPAKINYSPVSSDNNSLPLEEINSIQFKPKSNKILTIIIIFLAVILFGLAGFWIYAQYIKQDKEVSFDNLPNNSEQNIGNILENLSKELEQPVAEKPEEILPPATEPEPKIPSDIDTDGLNDEEEILLGTNPSRADTDLDGLSDYDEVKVYFTNPVKNDTDGDGYMDGIEIQNGYDPNGPGKLNGEEIYQERVLLTPDNLSQYNNPPSCEEKFNYDKANTTYHYSKSATGLAFDIPYNESWGNEKYKIQYYDKTEDGIVFGSIGPGEGCGWMRSHWLNFLPAKSADKVIENFQQDIGYPSMFGVQPYKVVIDGMEVVKYEMVGMCSHPVLQVIGEKYNYEIAPQCGGDIDEGFRYLENIVKTFEFLD